MASPVHANGSAMPRAADNDGACLIAKDRANRVRDYPDVEGAPHAKLLSLSCKIYGRWGNDSLQFVRQLCNSKASQVTLVLQATTAHAYARRWWALLGAGLQKSLADAILRPAGADLPSAISSLEQYPLCDILDFSRGLSS